MARRSKGPVYYPSKKAWFANINKEPIKLIEGPKKATEKDASERYNKLKQVRAAEIEGDKSATWVVLNAYLTSARSRIVPPPLAPNTYRMHESAINDLCAFEYEPGKKCGNVQVRSLKMEHFQKWIAARKQGRLVGTKKVEVKWSDTFAHLQLRILRTALKWAANEGELISESPFARKGKKARLGTADLSLKRLAIRDEEHAELLHQASRRRKGNFAALLQFLYHTGARPAEIYLAQAEEWDATRQAIVIDPADPRSTGRLKNRRHLMKQGRKRVIRIPNHLVPSMEKLRSDHPDGPLFRMEDDKPWTSCGKIADRMKSLINAVNRDAVKQGKLQVVRPEVTLYSYRHAYVTRFLRSGGKVMVLCELLNTSLAMLQAHYSHLLEEHDELLDAVNQFATPTQLPRHPHMSSASGVRSAAS